MQLKVYRLRIWSRSETGISLGFVVTRDLGYDYHCEQIAAKADMVVYNLFRALFTRNTKVHTTAFKYFIMPLLEFGVVLFNLLKKKTIQRLDAVQNCFTRKLLIREQGFVYATSTFRAQSPSFSCFQKTHIWFEMVSQISARTLQLEQKRVRRIEKIDS